MKYSRFEELPVWNDAADLYVAVCAFLKEPFFQGRGKFRDQLESATLSISNNIAEGFERGSNAELLNFIYIAKGSAGEVRSMLAIVNRMPNSQSVSVELPLLRKKIESISRQLGAWAESIKNSSNKGDKYVSDKTRKQEAARRDRDEFVRELRNQHEELLRKLAEQQEKQS